MLAVSERMSVIQGMSALPMKTCIHVHGSVLRRGGTPHVLLIASVTA